jgi:hypothetical protein
MWVLNMADFMLEFLTFCEPVPSRYDCYALIERFDELIKYTSG